MITNFIIHKLFPFYHTYNGGNTMDLCEIKKEIGYSKDYIVREITIDKKKIIILFNEVLTSSTDCNEFILDRLTTLKRKDFKNLLNILPDCNMLEIKKEEIFDFVNTGFFIIIADKIYAIEMKAALDRGIATAENELSLKGSKDAFSENFNTNLGLIRRRIKTTSLQCFDLNIGRNTKTKVGILYIKGIADLDLIEQIKLKLSTIDIDGILDSTYLKENLESKNSSFFPTIMSTERPDKVAMALLEGKAALLVDMSPYILIMPNFFIDFFHTVDDYYQKPINITFIRMIRVFAFLTAIFVPALYIMVTTHNYDLINLDVLLSLKAQRESVPFPAIIEAIFMMISFEILRESDIRMSSTSGNAVSILGGLILGDAAVSAGIISPIMIIVVAISAISGLVFNSIEMVSAIRWWRFILLFIASLFGIWGIIIGAIILFIRLATIKCFGKHYLAPFIPFVKSEFKDTIIKHKNKGEKYRNPLITNNKKRGHFR